jgi:hypothetical protein
MKDIASYPLAIQFQSCDSFSAILAVLRAQVEAFDKSQSADEKLTKWLDPTVNVISVFSAFQCSRKSRPTGHCVCQPF